MFWQQCSVCWVRVGYTFEIAVPSPTLLLAFRTLHVAHAQKVLAINGLAKGDISVFAKFTNLEKQIGRAHV